MARTRGPFTPWWSRTYEGLVDEQTSTSERLVGEDEHVVGVCAG